MKKATKNTVAKNTSNIPMEMTTVPEHLVGTKQPFSPLTFTLTAIKALHKKTYTKLIRVGGKSDGEPVLDANGNKQYTTHDVNHKGISAVHSGFNSAFKKVFPTIDPINATTILAEHGVIDLRPVTGSVMLYKAGDMQSSNNGDVALASILGADVVTS